MKASEIRVGGHYTAKVNGRLTTVRVDEIRDRNHEYGSKLGTTIYDVTNLSTGRKTTFRSAMKFRGEAKPPAKTNVEEVCERVLAGEKGLRVEEIQEAEQRPDPTSEMPTQQSKKNSVDGQANEAEQCSDPTSTSCVYYAEGGQSIATAVVPSSETATQDSPATEVTRRPFSRMTPTTQTPTMSPTTDGTATGAGSPSSDSDGNGTAQAAEPSTQAGEGEDRSDPTSNQFSSTPSLGTAQTSFAKRLASSSVLTSNDGLTEEQQQIIATVPNVQVLVIEAGAGCGKTFTLKKISEVMGGIGQYTAFNASLVAESKEKFSKRVRCNTIHSLAYGGVGYKYKHRLGGKRIMSGQLAAMLGLQPMTFDGPDGQPKTLTVGALATQVRQAVYRFTQSRDQQIFQDHFRPIPGIDKEGERFNSDMVRASLLPLAVKMWEDKCSPTGTMPFVHDDYVKIWELSKPVIGADYLLGDEWQDVAPVMQSIFDQQVERGMRTVLVGDSNQQIYCQPIGTRVRVVTWPTRRECDFVSIPIEELEVGHSVVSWNRNWRNGGIRKQGCKVKEIRTRKFDGQLIVAGVDGEESRYTPEHHCIALVGDAFGDRHVVYMMRRGAQYRIGRCPWRYSSQRNINGVVRRTIAEAGDAFWILSVHETSKEAALAEALTQNNFNLPGICFEPCESHLIPVKEFWEAVGPNSEQAKACLDHFGRLIDHPLWTRGDFQKFSRGPIITAAANLIPGMRMLAAKNAKHKGRITVSPDSCWTPISVRREWYTGLVYSISVDKDHTYIADGIITHNSWRGAINGLACFPGAPRLFLSKSFRFGQVVAEVANAILEHLQEPTKLVMRGFEKINSKLASLDSPTAVLCRTNAGALGRLLQGVQEGKRPCLIGKCDDIVSFVKAAISLGDGQPTEHPELCVFKNWKEVQAFSKTEEGDDLKLMVKLIDEFSPKKILNALERMPREEDADLVLSTAHKSKGREWKKVQLASDFKTLDKMGDEEVRLLYVAATRAQHVLDCEDCPPFIPGQRDKEGNPIPHVDLGKARKLSKEIKDDPTQPELQGKAEASKAAPPPQEARQEPAQACDNTWSKGRAGDWLVRGKIGQTGAIKVKRKDGGVKTVTVKRVVWENGEVALYEVAQ